MAKIDKVFVEFFGDPSDDKECYKRYTSTEKFEAVGHDAEVIEFTSQEKFDKLQAAFTAAQKYIEASPIDPDITNYQQAKWNEYLAAVEGLKA